MTRGVFGELAERLTSSRRLRRTAEWSDAGPEGVRDGVPNNALPCMARRAISKSTTIRFFGELAERLKALPC